MHFITWKRSSPLEVLSSKGVLKMYSKFTEGHPCRSVISINLFCKLTEIVFRHGCLPVNLLQIFQNTLLQEHLWRTTSDEKHDKRRYSHTIYFLSEIYKYYFYFSTWKTIKNISSYHLYCVFTVWSERWKEVIFMKD